MKKILANIIYWGLGILGIIVCSPILIIVIPALCIEKLFNWAEKIND